MVHQLRAAPGFCAFCTEFSQVSYNMSRVKAPDIQDTCKFSTRSHHRTGHLEGGTHLLAGMFRRCSVDNAEDIVLLGGAHTRQAQHHMLHFGHILPPNQYTLVHTVHLLPYGLFFHFWFQDTGCRSCAVFGGMRGRDKHTAQSSGGTVPAGSFYHMSVISEGGRTPLFSCQGAGFAVKQAPIRLPAGCLNHFRRIITRFN